MRNVARALMLVLVAAALFVSAAAEAASNRKKRAKPAPPVSAEVVMDAATGRVLHAKNADVATYPASLTKMMTLLLAFEALDRGDLRPGQLLPVSYRAASMAPSRLGLVPGGHIVVEDAISALVVKSANDVAVVLAEAMDGSEQAFAVSMTRRARALGMARTTFRNASGLPHREQRTTARDMATLSRFLVRLPPRHYAHFSRGAFAWEGEVVRSHNRLLARYEGMDGIKTGFIAASGFNLAASATRDGRRLIAVVLGGESASRRDDRVADLLDKSFGSSRPRLDPGPLIASLAEPEAEGDADPDEPAVALVRPVAAPQPVQGGAVQARPAQSKPVQAKPVPAKAAPKKTARGGWAVQVGAFSTEAAARTKLQDSRKLLGGLAAGAKPTVTRSGKLYHARFLGVDQGAASKACALLKARGQGCLSVQAR